MFSKYVWKKGGGEVLTLTYSLSTLDLYVEDIAIFAPLEKEV